MLCEKFIGADMREEITIEKLFFEDIYKISYPSFGDSTRGAYKLFERKEGNALDALEFNADELMVFHSGRGILRGMHYQSHLCKNQDRLIYLLSGKLFFAIVDLDENRSSYGEWKGVTISEKDCAGIYIPGSYAIGTLAEEDSSFLMLYSGEYINGYDRGFRYDDDTVGIEWTLSKKDIIVADKDLSLPSFLDRSK